MTSSTAIGLAGAAHLHRRTSLALDPTRVDELAEMSWTDAVETVLAQEPDGAHPPDADRYETISWWLAQMLRPDAGLPESMAWCWHGLLTTHAEKVSADRLVADQLSLLRAGALGNYRTLLKSFVTSGALLEYLDAAWSEASNPNENLARELMELFTTGRGHYTQDDVRGAARALAGWVVGEDGVVSWERERAFVAPLLILGVQADWDTESLIDHLCDLPATASHVAGHVWQHLVGAEPPAEIAAELGAWWSAHDLEIRPLVERILLDERFLASRLQRPRSGLEWLVAASSVSGVEIESPWQAGSVGQIPYEPPNVGGWPGGNRWLGAGSLLSRLHAAWGVEAEDVGIVPRRTDDLLHRLCLPDASTATRAVLDRRPGTGETDARVRDITRWRLALTCPEFHLS